MNVKLATKVINNIKGLDYWWYMNYYLNDRLETGLRQKMADKLLLEKIDVTNKSGLSVC
jgi:hypothetical protein